MGKILQTLIIFVLLLALPTASAIKTFQQNTDVDIIHPIRINDAIPSFTTFCNLTAFYPNESVLIDFQRMTDNTDYFNYTINNTLTSIKGTYNYDVTCAGGGFNKTDSFQFLINLGGVEPSEERTSTLSRTIFIFFGLGVLAFILMIASKRFPIKSSLFLVMIWFFLIGLNTTVLALQDEVVNPNIENFFSSILVISYIMNWFIFTAIGTIWAITFFVHLFVNKEEKKKQKHDGEF